MTKVHTVVMDKTGTLTKGVFNVQKVSVTDFDKQLLLKLTAALESSYTHQVAKAVVAYAQKSEVPYQKAVARETEELAGQGLKGNVAGFKIRTGNPKLMQKFGQRHKTS